jgi:predicted RND superfamily exporter protein
MRRLGGALILVAVLVAALTLAGWLVDPGLRVTASSSALLLENDPEVHYYNATRQLFESDEYIIIAFQVEDPLGPESLAVLDQLEATLWNLPDVEKVLSLLSAPLLRSGPAPFLLTMTPTYVWGEGMAEARLELAGEELREHELFGDLLLSRQGNVVALLVYLRIDPRLEELDRRRDELHRALETAGTAEERASLTAELSRVEERHRPLHLTLEANRRRLVAGVGQLCERVGAEHHLTIHQSGIPVINVAMASYVRHDLELFGVVSLVLAAVALLILLRGVGRVLLVLLAAVITVVTTLGIMVLTDTPVTVVTCNLPSLLFVLSLAHGIHLVERWRRLGAVEGLGGLVRHLFLPCLLTATTTMAGFLALVVTDLRPVIDFGTYMSLGVGIALVVAFLAVPAGLAIGSRPAARASRGPSPLATRLLGQLARWSLRRGRVILVTSLVLLLAALGLSLRLGAETKFSDYFKEDSVITVGLEYIDRQLVGITTMEIFLEAPPGQTFRSAWGVKRIAAVEGLCADLPAVTKVESLASVVREVEKLPGLPRDTEVVLNLLGQFDMVEQVLRTYVTPDGQHTRVLVRLRETDPDLDRGEVLSQLRDRLAAAAELQELRPHPTGIFVLHANLLDSLITSMRRSFLYVTLAILLMFLCIFRSPGAALLALVPSVLPVVLVLGAMGLLGIPLDLVTVMIASVSMGIGVDAAIHYLYAYRVRIRAGDSEAEAIQQAHETVGRPILFAALTVVAAFGVLVLSEFIPSIYFGAFTALTMLAALAGTLTLLPAALVRVRPFQRPPRVVSSPPA